jgi:hypothetical protein
VIAPRDVRTWFMYPTTSSCLLPPVFTSSSSAAPTGSMVGTRERSLRRHLLSSCSLVRSELALQTSSHPSDSLKSES